MATIVLHECKIRDNRVVPKREVRAVPYTWEELLDRFLAHIPATPAQRDWRVNAATGLRRLERGFYVGLVRAKDDPEQTHLFVFGAQGRDNLLDPVTRQDDTWASRVLSIHRVESVQWDVVRSEAAHEEPLAEVYKPADHVVRQERA